MRYDKDVKKDAMHHIPYPGRIKEERRLKLKKATIEQAWRGNEERRPWTEARSSAMVARCTAGEEEQRGAARNSESNGGSVVRRRARARGGRSLAMGRHGRRRTARPWWRAMHSGRGGAQRCGEEERVQRRWFAGVCGRSSGATTRPCSEARERERERREELGIGVGLKWEEAARWWGGLRKNGLQAGFLLGWAKKKHRKRESGV